MTNLTYGRFPLIVAVRINYMHRPSSKNGFNRHINTPSYIGVPTIAISIVPSYTGFPKSTGKPLYILNICICQYHTLNSLILFS